VGGRDFKAEKLNAYEIGYRFWPHPGLVFDLAAFYNDYADLRSGLAAGSYTEEDPAPVHLVIPFEAVNLLEAETYGVEVAADWHSATLPWRCRAAYSYLEIQLHVGPGVDPVRGQGAEGENPAHQFYVWSSTDLRRDIHLDGVARFVDRLPWHDFDAYLGLDLRLAWEPMDDVEIALVGRDLLNDHHPESRAFFVDTEPTETQRSAYATLSWTF
jgi:iron complex outermembrane receptor protein